MMETNNSNSLITMSQYGTAERSFSYMLKGQVEVYGGKNALSF